MTKFEARNNNVNSMLLDKGPSHQAGHFLIMGLYLKGKLWGVGGQQAGLSLHYALGNEN